MPLSECRIPEITIVCADPELMACSVFLACCIGRFKVEFQQCTCSAVCDVVGKWLMHMSGTVSCKAGPVRFWNQPWGTQHLDMKTHRKHRVCCRHFGDS
jgi:hypothetical protein